MDIRECENKCFIVTDDDGKEYGHTDLRKAMTRIVRKLTGKDVTLSWKVKE